jgi:hypothetical protein
MNDMILSPMQQGDITRGEFNDLKSFINDGFELTNEHIDHVEESMKAQFNGVNEQFKGVNEKFMGVDEQFKGVNGRIDSLESNMNKQFTDQKEDIAQLTKLVTKIAVKIL